MMYGDNSETTTAKGMPNPLAWGFLGEPLWRWFIFIIALGFLLRAWRGILAEMK